MNTLDDIAARLAGYDPQAMRADQVAGFLQALVDALGPLSAALDAQTRPVGDSLGWVLASSVVSPIDVPAHDNSAMDGFAFNGADLVSGQPTVLEIVGAALAGSASALACERGQCVRVTTGAVMPTGTDTVVPRELTQLAGQHISVPAQVVRRTDNRRLRGEDIARGAIALPAGTRLMPAALGLLASLGLPNVSVLRRLRVATFSTGSEVLSLGDAPRTGAVYDSNRYTLRGLLTRLGCELIDLGVVPDEQAALRRAFLEAAAQADVVITSGGVSVGEADFTKVLMRELGDVAFWRVAMRPGRPMAVGVIEKPALSNKSAVSQHFQRVLRYENDSKWSGDNPAARSHALLFGLPGNPVAVMVTFLAFVRPALLHLMGANELPPPLLKASSLELMRKKPGRTEYQRGVVSISPQGQLQVKTTGNQGSGVLSSMVQANGLIVLHHDQSDVAVGDAVDVMVFEGVI